MEQNNNNLSTTKRLRIIESVMPITKDAPEILETLQKMGIPHWDIAKILAGATVGHDESLVNPEDGLPHFIRHCELAMMDPDKLLDENRYLRSLNADAQDEIKRLRKRVDYLNDLIDRFKISIRPHAD